MRFEQAMRKSVLHFFFMLYFLESETISNNNTMKIVFRQAKKPFQTALVNQRLNTAQFIYVYKIFFVRIKKIFVRI